MAISRSFLFMRIPSSRLVSVRFVMRVHWIVSVFCGGIIIVATAVFSGFVSFLFMNSVFQFWFSFIWFVMGLCCISSVSFRKVIVCGSLSSGISRAVVMWFRLCHWLSLNRLSSFSSFVDNAYVPSIREGVC